MHVPPNVYDERLAICNDCHRFHKARGQCGACGCIMTVKARGAHTKCPMGIWGAYTPGSLN